MGRPQRRGQAYAGTDRAVRGALLTALRADRGPVRRSALEAAVAELADPEQRERCLDSLLADGLVQSLGDQTFTLPR